MPLGSPSLVASNVLSDLLRGQATADALYSAAGAAALAQTATTQGHRHWFFGLGLLGGHHVHLGHLHRLGRHLDGWSGLVVREMGIEKHTCLWRREEKQGIKG